MEISINNLTLQLNNKPIFNNLNFNFKKGCFNIINGESGSGKSTLFYLINHLKNFNYTGTISYNKNQVTTSGIEQLRRDIILIPQKPYLLQDTVRENIIFPFKFKINHFLSVPKDHQLHEMLELFNLRDIDLDSNASDTSVGQQQRLSIIRALLLKPKVLLLDETFSSLDQNNRLTIFNVLKNYNKKYLISIIISSHIELHKDLDNIKIIELNNGTLSEVSR